MKCLVVIFLLMLSSCDIPVYSKSECWELAEQAHNYGHINGTMDVSEGQSLEEVRGIVAPYGFK